MRVTRILAAVVAMTGWTAAFGIPSASADPPCPDVDVVFARGTGEPPGPGGVGQAFVDSLSSHLPGRSVALYPVNYPATPNYAESAAVGADDASAHVRDMVGACPNTKTVLGGYSQGAGVATSATGMLPPPTADHVAAVVLFGRPASTYASNSWGGPLPVISPAYQPKTMDFCVPDDSICSEGNNPIAHVSYVGSDLIDQAAVFAAERL
ncbi:putative cutinase [Mycobacterium sp. MFM001]|uniref:cutinase family protein n=1 Tax=Mycobacterium sp. MFM001 TaxID=2049453 RepID=UPI000DA5116E|nr:cutinase family protein [Mycobacterium sp. MFM001]GBE64215.1 putative cutinase [Mycobacterium sp. MFM001]